jgi:predicted RNase H-like HicB family nuclease
VLFARRKFDQDEFFALQWKRPDNIQVFINRAEEGGYFAKIVSLAGNVVTEADTGQALVEMVNEAMYDYLDIPPIYRPQMGLFMPSEEVREEIKAEIPAKYLNTNIGLARVG